ncbi:hypothetical protein EJ04DRAFT_100715 [Polyplosphaeria fusca]|uniref:Ferric oxidoreductase domain-containing protein n=1 Tax=Polyplosphaeria fusca TaxID=682080 RepID=A0A9P4UXQ2_9PLEO|nr:hypothetical protein EJ04DRAFT_100715 [Polyplosphaeria fusca]
MHTTSKAAVIAAVWMSSATGHVTKGYYGHGLIGYGIEMYRPPCAWACRDSIRDYMLDCEMHHPMSTGAHDHLVMPECHATNDAFLTTLGWCIHTHCGDEVPVSQREDWWERYVAGRVPGQPKPKYSYGTAVTMVEAQGSPTLRLTEDDEWLNETALVDEEMYVASFNGDDTFERTEMVTSRFGIVLILACTMVPMAFSLLRFVPFPQSLVSKFYATVVDPPAFGSKHATPILGLGIMPTRGQALFIAYIWILNIILCAVGYQTSWPNSWWSSMDQQMVEYVGNRTGLLSFVNLTLSVLYASRNNALLWLTNWSHSTFLLVHRWIAVICMLQACIHSALYLQMYVDMGDGAYEKESKEEYWAWGITATLALVLLIPFSLLPIRRKVYEFFLASHVIFAVLSMIGCLLHIYYRYEWQWGYQMFVYVAFVLWTFDRFLARPLRLVRNGVKRAYVTVIDEDYLKIEVPGVHAEGQAYLYFPTLTWRVWENHPFSVVPVPGGALSEDTVPNPSTSSSDLEIEKQAATASVFPATQPSHRPGIAFFVRRLGGLTSQLALHANSANGIPILVESSYGPEKTSIIPSPVPRPSLDYPNVVCIAGGVGITGVLPWLSRGLLAPTGRTKLYWGVRTSPLVRSIQDMLRVGGNSRWDGAEVTVSVGERFNLRDVLETEVRGAVGGTMVLVCGPEGMRDEVRLVVSRLGRNGAVVRLSEDSFSW